MSHKMMLKVMNKVLSHGIHTLHPGIQVTLDDHIKGVCSEGLYPLHKQYSIKDLPLMALAGCCHTAGLPAVTQPLNSHLHCCRGKNTQLQRTRHTKGWKLFNEIFLTLSKDICTAYITKTVWQCIQVPRSHENNWKLVYNRTLLLTCNQIEAM